MFLGVGVAQQNLDPTMFLYSVIHPRDVDKLTNEGAHLDRNSSWHIKL
jgi:hypothetical protein